MAHVYRLHDGGPNTLDGWGTSKQYGQNEIKRIVDPSGATAKLPITSVPTPFAGLELAKNAFETCATLDKHGKDNISGDTIYHKLVSFSLDVLEILFNFDKFQNDIEIIAWDSQTEITKLKNSFEPAHQRLGQTLDLYINQDKAGFNFSNGMFFYILNYIHGPAPLNIIGGTSSTSLAFASTNNLDYLNIPLSGNHLAFNSSTIHYRSLIERDNNFIKYLWTLSLQPGFSNNYPAVYQYLQVSYRSIQDANLKNELQQISAGDIQNYDPIMVGAAHLQLPGGIGLYAGQKINASTVSDFTILSDYETTLPLVLPNEAGYNLQMVYTTGCWDPRTKAPYYDPLPMGQRILPNDGSKHPYLTADDIFQPYIIRTVFSIDEKNYFTCHLKTDGDYSYLLPLKPEIFKYLKPETITGTTRGARPKNIFELKEIAGGGVEAIINIPVQKGNYITMRRRYLNTDEEPDASLNKGIIIDCNFDMFLFPAYHIANGCDVETPQRVYLIDNDIREISKHFDYTVKLFKAQKDFGHNIVDQTIVRGNKELHAFTSKIFSSKEEFDIVQVSNGFADGMLIPKYNRVGSGSDAFEFAIDFGTTNTHIEYHTQGENLVHALELSQVDSAVLTMHKQDSEFEQKAIANYSQMFVYGPYQEFVPLAFGSNEFTGFPLRTNICQAATCGDNDNIRTKLTIGDYSIGFHYEKENTFVQNKTITNLKWLGDNTTEKYVHSFFEELLLLIRTKILRGGGDLNKTKITWFYPVCMEPFRLAQLSDEWDSLCHELISPNCQIQRVTESLAPFYYYKNEEGVTAACRPVVLMDIGGGTTDFAVYQGNVPALISSVRFAGNSLYGDFPGFGIKMNGFYNRYYNDFKSKIDNARIAALSTALNNITNRADSADFVSFLYSLEKNTELKKKNIDISFSETLKKDYSMKTAILLFYVGELFYLAKVLQSKGIGTPAYLTISGTGSKVLKLLGNTNILGTLAKIIFNDILGDSENIELKEVSNPKEITCKGGLKMLGEDVVASNNSDQLRYIYTASKTLNMSGRIIKLRDIDSQSCKEVLEVYEQFVNYFITLHSKFNFEKNFGINTQGSFSDFKSVLLEHANEDLAAVLDTRKKEHQDVDAELEDSLFFFPLAGGLNRLVNYISQNL